MGSRDTHKASIPKETQPEALDASEIIRQRRSKIITRRSAQMLLMRILLIVAAGWVVFTQVFGVYRVDGEEMYPRIRDGDLVISYRLQKSPIIGDVVAYQHQGKRYFGRVVAVGGDTVDFSADGRYVRNGNAQQEEVFFPTTAQNRSRQFPMALHEFELFLLGDNREQAEDGRDFGALNRDNIEGVVIAVLRRRGI